MFTWIFLGVFLFFALLFIGIGMLNGRKFVWVYSALKAISTVLSAVIAMLLASLVAKLVVNVAYDKIIETGILGEFGKMLEDIASAPQIIAAIFAMIVAPMMFLPIFWILRPILKIFAKIGARELIKVPFFAPKKNEYHDDGSFSKKEKKFRELRVRGSNPLGLTLGGVCGLLLMVVLAVPVIGPLSVADDVIGTVAVFSDDEIVTKISEISSASDDGVGATVVKALGGKAVYSCLTTYKVGNDKVSLVKEAELVSSVGQAIYAVSNENVTRERAASSVRHLSHSFSESSVLPVIASDFLNAANESWSQDQSFHGISKPLKNMGGMSDTLFELLADSDSSTIRADVSTVVNIFAIVVEKDAVDKIKSNATAILSDEELVANIMMELLSNERLAPMVASITEWGFDMLGNKIGANFSSLKFDSSHITDKEAESKALAAVLGDVFVVMEKMNSNEIDALGMARELGPILDSLKHTQIIGADNTADILEGIFLAEDIYSEIGLSRDEAESMVHSINDKAGVRGYTPLMNAMIDTVEIVKMSTDSSASNVDMAAKIEILLQDLTPESAELLQEMTSANVIASKGVPEQSAEPMANMFSDMFGGLSEAKENGMPEEQYKKEAAAMTDVMNIAMNFDKADSSSMFGEGSATGVGANEFVDNIFDSTVISATVVDTAYTGEGASEPDKDPLKFGKELGQADKDDMIGALNNKWSSATDEQKADEEYRKTYLALGSLMNINIGITDQGVVENVVAG